MPGTLKSGDRASQAINRELASKQDIATVPLVLSKRAD